MWDKTAKIAAGVAVGSSIVAFGALALSRRRGAGLARLESGAVYPPLPTRHGAETLVVVVPPRGRISGDDQQRLLMVLDRASGPIGVAIHALGGMTYAVDHMATALRAYPGRVTAYIPYQAMSGGTIVALGADEIVMNERAVLGPVDPQIAGFPAHSIDEVSRAKPIERLDEQWFMLGVEARKAISETERLLQRLDVPGAAVTRLAGGVTTHGKHISAREAQSMGLPIKIGVPKAVVDIVDLAVREASFRDRCMPYYIRTEVQR